MPERFIEAIYIILKYSTPSRRIKRHGVDRVIGTRIFRRRRRRTRTGTRIERRRRRHPTTGTRIKRRRRRRTRTDTRPTRMGTDIESTSFDGGPPLPLNRITRIPEVSVTNDQFNSRLQCSVCCEYFKVEEIVRCLPCLHLYHDACIRPWLLLHASCPLCRASIFQSDN